ncbi:DNA adenine methylase [Campylobacter geochelonis]|uniref:DNA adenine methylase n=1 Tax=Campylobacter geochelonis TaxID=1780362 RepID=UPI00077085CE|nr:DNA adenine methylase [Campylobacter geochelonis]CZE50299.1 Adenine-specific DNA methylase [Campylobacter geochelonis]
MNYIGNKQKISEWICQNLPVQNGIFVDAFCGACSIAYKAKELGFKVISNDVLYSNFVISKAIIENSNELLDNNFESIEICDKDIQDKFQQISYLANKIYFEPEVMELAKLSLISHHLKGYQKYIFLTLLRRAMIRKIPYSRMTVSWEEIQKLRNEEYSYAKYGRRRAYHNQTFLSHIKNYQNEYNNAVFNNSMQSKSYHKDIFDFVKIIEYADIVYLDPPYPSTMNNYKGFYGYFDEIFDKSAEFTDFTNKTNFASNFLELIKKLKNKTKFIAISLNNRCNPNVDELLKSFKPFIKDYKILTKEHIYKVTGKENKKTNYEILLILEV